jgi:hypothetical protein
MTMGLHIALDDDRTFWWPLTELCQTQGFYAGEPVRFERGGELPEVLMIEDPAFLRALHAVAPEAARRFHDPARRRLRAGLVLLAALGVVGIAVALHLWAFRPWRPPWRC